MPFSFYIPAVVAVSRGPWNTAPNSCPTGHLFNICQKVSPWQWTLCCVVRSLKTDILCILYTKDFRGPRLKSESGHFKERYMIWVTLKILVLRLQNILNWKCDGGLSAITKCHLHHAWDVFLMTVVKQDTLKFLQKDHGHTHTFTKSWSKGACYGRYNPADAETRALSQELNHVPAVIKM